MVKIKVCGITNLEDALAAVEYGADALGFVFVRESPRYIPWEKALSIIKGVPFFTTTIGVFANESLNTIEKIVSSTGLDIIQLHGNEPPELCKYPRRIIKAIRVKSLESLDPLSSYQGLVSAFLLDAYTPNVLGGSGQIFNWDIALEAKQFGKIILAGGLTPDNVVEAVRRVQPYGVDVSSGVEQKKGKKDLKKMKLFIKRAQSAQD